jgi:hypothetical protein
MMTSPGDTDAAAHTIGTLTLPGLVFEVPCDDTALDHTGNPSDVISLVSRTPASMITPATPCAMHDSASSSPNIPSVDSDMVAMTSTSPG